MLLVYSAGAAPPIDRALIGVAVAAAGLAVDFATASERNASGAVFISLLIVLPWIAGRGMHRHGRRAELLEERADRLERERERHSHEAVLEERARIARELHDMVAHAVSLVVVQAEAAEAVLDSDRERTRRQLRAIQLTGRQALAEMTRLLGLLRTDEHDPGTLAPQPGLARLDALLAETRAAGLPVEVAIEGEPIELPPGIELAAYRIVQEALTNTRKHAAATSAHVTLRYQPDALELLIVDDGRGGNGRGNGGHGLIGMRERVHLYGGTLDAGPRPGGGYVVSAHIPREPARR